MIGALNIGDKELKHLDEYLVKTGDDQGSQHGHPCTRDNDVDASGNDELAKKMCGQDVGRSSLGIACSS